MSFESLSRNRFVLFLVSILTGTVAVMLATYIMPELASEGIIYTALIFLISGAVSFAVYEKSLRNRAR